jgi:hypothetical protein
MNHRRGRRNLPRTVIAGVHRIDLGHACLPPDRRQRDRDCVGVRERQHVATAICGGLEGEGEIGGKAGPATGNRQAGWQVDCCAGGAGDTAEALVPTGDNRSLDAKCGGGRDPVEQRGIGISPDLRGPTE